MLLFQTRYVTIIKGYDDFSITFQVSLNFCKCYNKFCEWDWLESQFKM